MKPYTYPWFIFVLICLASALPASALPGEILVPCPDEAIEGQYIVALEAASFRPHGSPLDARPTLPEVASQMARQHAGEITALFELTAPGFAIDLPEQAARRLARDPRVRVVEQDCPVHLSAAWHEDRVDERFRPLDGNVALPETGSGVNVYVVDSGIANLTSEFGSRLKNGVDCVPGTCSGSGKIDNCGHGTTVASVLGGSTRGIAPGVNLHPVRVMNSSCSPATTMRVRLAVEWVTANHVDPAVMTMTWFFVDTASGVSTFETAVLDARAAGIVVVASANNLNDDACKGTPAQIPQILTVGGTDESDRRWGAATCPHTNPAPITDPSHPCFQKASNWGSCIDLSAPAKDIAVIDNTGAARTLSGTSYSAPLVAGAAAMYLQLNSTASPATVESFILGNATSGVLSGDLGPIGNKTPNRLLLAEPVHACFSWSCNSATDVCNFDASCSKAPAGKTFRWNWGDGSSTITTSTSASHNFGNSIYFVTLTVDPAIGGDDVQTGG